MAATHIYIGVRKSDGSIRATCCDDPGEEADTAKKVSDWLKRGLAVERLTDAEYHERFRLEYLTPPPSQEGDK